jgi:hypothetical protein
MGIIVWCVLIGVSTLRHANAQQQMPPPNGVRRDSYAEGMRSTFAAAVVSTHQELLGQPDASRQSHPTTPHRTTSSISPAAPTWTLTNFTQQIDHTDFLNNGTFEQRYLVCADWWKPEVNAPIFFFTGAEGGDITRLYGWDYGYANQVAQSMNALVV